MTTIDIAGAAATAEKAVEGVMKVEPMVAGVAGMFVPQLALIQPWIVMLAPDLEKALTAISAGNNGNVLQSVIQLIQHISKGQPNAPELSPPSPENLPESA